MNRKLLRLSEQLLIMSGLQVLALYYLKTVVVPSFFLVWLLILVWEGDVEISLAMAFVTGMIYDIISKGVLGTSGVLLIIIVYVNSFFKLRSLTGRFIGIFLFSILYFIAFLFERQHGFLWGTMAVIRYSVFFALYNSAVFFIIELGMRRVKWRGKKDYLSI